MYLTFICVFGSLLILFRFLETRIIYNKLNLYFFVSTFLLLSLFPFFILGPYSAIGGYDEQDGQILWYWLLNESGPGSKYLYEYAGGTYSKHGFLSGNEIFSLYQYMSLFVPEWLANTIYKLLGLLILFSGIYQSSRKIFKLSRAESTYIGIFAATTSYLPYYFALGGYGWNMGLMSWIPLIFFMESKKSKLYAKAGLLGILATISSEPFILIPLACYCYFVFFVFFYALKKISFNLHQISAAFLTIALFTLGHFYQIVELNEVLDSAARFTYNTYDYYSWLDVLYQKALAVYLSLRRPPHYLIPITIILFLILKLVKKENFKILVQMIVLIFILPFLLSVMFNLLQIPIAKSFRWEQFIYLFIVGGPFFLMSIFKDRVKINKAIFILSIMSVIGISINATVALRDMDVRGGYITKTHYDVLFEGVKNKEEFRIVSNNYLPPPGLPLHYEMHTLDGMKLSSGIRRMFFFQFLNKADAPHTHRHIVRFDEIKDKLELLKMANVKYAISNLPIPGLHLKRNIEGIKLKNLFGSGFLPLEILNLNLANDLYLFEISEAWPFIFSGDIHRSAYSYSEEKFYDELINLDKYSSSIASDDIEKYDFYEEGFEKADLLEYTRTENILNIKLQRGGSLTINLEFNERWIASCNGNLVKIFPTNAIMMTLITPQDCKDLYLEFKSKLD